MFLSFLDPKIQIQPNIIWWGIGGLFTFIGLVVGTVVKITTKNYLGRKEIEEKYVEKNICKILHKNIETDIKDIKKKTECVPAIKLGMDLLLKKNGLKIDE